MWNDILVSQKKSFASVVGNLWALVFAMVDLFTIELIDLALQESILYK